ncbi:MAG: MmcQ/YjbR family DNA-binding protein [Candidatus Acidiferrum sp.]
MTPNEFRKLALSLPGTAEHAHMNHPDFRVGGKIFATMGYPDKTRAMVKVTPVEQEMLVRAEPEVFSPVKGKWGLQGGTSVNLKAAKKQSMRRAIAAAWELAAPEELRGEVGNVAVRAAMRPRGKGRKRSLPR